MPLAAAAVLFFLSGTGALVVETTWQRWFRLLFGATAPATSATLVAFLAGQAAGAALGARRVVRWRRPLRAYATLEIVAGAGALAVPLLLAAGEGVVGALYGALGDSPIALAGVRFALALVATLPASLALGATLPAMAAAAVPERRTLGEAGAPLYAAQLLGAALGAGLAAYFLADWLGVRGGYGVGVGCSLLAAAGAFALDRRASGSETITAEAAKQDPTRERHVPRSARKGGTAPPSPTGLLGLAAFSGAGTFAAQVLLIEAFAQVLNQSAYAFGAVLVTVLATLGAGSAAVATLARRGIRDLRAVLSLALAASALGFAAFPALLSFWTDGFAFVGAETAWPAYLWKAQLTAFAGAGPALLAAALVFPLCFALAGEEASGTDPRPGGAGALLGRLAAANTLGAIAGALLAPWALLPGLGLWPAFVALAAAYAAAALWLGGVSPRARLATAALLAGGAVVVFGLASPLRLPPVRLDPGETLLYSETSAAGVVSVIERRGERLVRTDNHYNLGGTADRVHQERQGHLPLLLHPGARKVVHLGAATGISAGASLAHPVEKLFVVELVPGVAHAAERFFADANRGVYADPHTRVVVDDARNFLGHTRERFDVVVADLFVPWRAGTGSLYAREHFAAVRQRLEPGGLFCQWLPLYQLTRREFEVLAATFVDVFPRAALWRGDFFGAFPIAALVGWRDEVTPVASVAEATRALAARGETDRWVTDPSGVWALYVGPLGPLADALAEAPRNSDDRPRIEFLSARSHAGGRRGKQAPFTGLPWARFAAVLREAAARQGDPLYGPLPDFARRATDGGAALQAAGAYWTANRHPEASQALAAAAQLLPDHLLAAAPPDPTAADVWPDTPTPDRGTQ